VESISVFFVFKAGLSYGKKESKGKARSKETNG